MMTATKKQGGASPLVSKVLKLNAKIKQGYYQFEEATCFCGKDDSVQVLDKDRYGIFYEMHLCRNCGLLFAKHQMTDESAKEFYEKEYREIYDHGLDIEDEFNTAVEASSLLRELLSENDVTPHVVFDIGCNDGSRLMHFKDCEAYGVDYNERGIAYGKSKGLNLIYGGIEQLEVLNKKADLIILNHVFEHFKDLEKELDRISKLLTDDGVLYIAVPSFYGWDLNMLFQNAHNWQFTVNTLEYVMQCCGYKPMFCDGNIISLWYYTGDRRPKEEVNPNEARDIWGYAFSGKTLLPQITTHCKFTLHDRRENIRKTLAYRFPDIRELHEKEAGREFIVIAGAPSINKYRERIKSIDAVVIAIDRMYAWCLENGIVPDYVVAIDGDEDVKESFIRLDKRTTHIVASIVKPEICELLKDYKTYIFSSEQAGVTHLPNVWEEYGYSKTTLLNVGGTVTLACFMIGLYLGMRDVHIFGFDCHVGNGNYADGIAGKGDASGDMQLKIDGKIWHTTPVFAAFAQQFFQLYMLAKNNELLDSVKIYGDSLIKAMSKIDLEGEC